MSIKMNTGNTKKQSKGGVKTHKMQQGRLAYPKPYKFLNR